MSAKLLTDPPSLMRFTIDDHDVFGAFSLTMYLAISGGADELVPLKELATSTPYSQEYLSLRARQGALDAAKIGGVWHSSRRAVARYVEGL